MHLISCNRPLDSDADSRSQCDFDYCCIPCIDLQSLLLVNGPSELYILLCRLFVIVKLSIYILPTFCIVISTNYKMLTDKTTSFFPKNKNVISKMNLHSLLSFGIYAIFSTVNTHNDINLSSVRETAFCVFGTRINKLCNQIIGKFLMLYCKDLLGLLWLVSFGTFVD